MLTRTEPVTYAGRNSTGNEKKEENASKRPKTWKNKSKGGEDKVEALLTKFDLLNYSQECK